jgi:uncharacterized protein YjbI with pentapeptide repeats
MKCTVLQVVTVVLALATSANAVTLVVMGVNTTAIAGSTVFDVGVQVTSADVAAGGTQPTLLVQNLTFSGEGSAVGPIQAGSTSNAPDIQTTWRLLDINGGQGGPSFPAAGQAAIALYADSWWYSSASGTLQGYIDSAGDVGTVTTVPAADGSGIYAQGPGALVGTTGYTWQPVGNGITGGASSGSGMGMTALFGPPGQDFLDPSPGGPFTDPNHRLGDMLVANGGTLTVPLAQIVASGDIRIPSQFNGGLGTFIDVGTPVYNVLGGPVGTDPGAVLNPETHTLGPFTPLAAFSDHHGEDYSFYNGAGLILTGINLSGGKLTGANFSSTDFTSANLSMADLTSANLAGAIFSTADLTSANLAGAIFSGANLMSATLRNANVAQAVTAAQLRSAANVTGVDLSGNDLSRFDLHGLDFSSAHFNSANLSSANLANAIFTNADLTGANLNQAILPTALPMLPVINGAAVALHGTLTVSGQTQVAPGGTLSLDPASTLNTNQLSLCGTLDVALGGRMAGSQYSQVNISDSATLGGTLNVALRIVRRITSAFKSGYAGRRTTTEC